MNTFAAVGFTSFGVFIGIIVSWATSGRIEPSPKAYSSLITAVVAAAVGFVPLFSPTRSDEMWLYPVGMLLGLLVVGPIADILLNYFYSTYWARESEERGKRPHKIRSEKVDQATGKRPDNFPV